jgi:hypothetical protein
VGVLALPATAIRRVNAGLIVGNPVGGSNTRAKALTSAELKAIIEASGISYLPSSGGTLTGALSTSGRLNSTVSENSGNIVGRLTLGSSNTGIWNTGGNNLVLSAGGTHSFLVTGYTFRGWANTSIQWASINDNGTQLANAIADLILTRGAANHLRQRNGINPLTFDLTGTYTSATSFESLCLKATASAMQIGSAIGSAGGTNRPLQLGHFDAAGTFTSGLSVATNGTLTLSSTLTTSGNINGSTLIANTTGSIRFNNRSIMRAPSDGALSLANSAGTFGVLLDFSTSTLTLHDIDGTTPINVRCGAITHVPSSSVTLSTNGQFSIEMTSNTAGNLVYRGSDGTERRMALVFV